MRNAEDNPKHLVIPEAVVQARERTNCRIIVGERKNYEGDGFC